MSLPESLDFFDVVWTLTFRRHLLQVRSHVDVASLALAATSRDEFQARLSALADTLKAMDVPDDLIASSTEIGRDRTLDRLQACLVSKVDEDGREQVRASIETLRRINRVRAALQHSGARAELPEALQALGVRYPFDDWSTAWDMIRSRAVTAISALRDGVRRLAE